MKKVCNGRGCPNLVEQGTRLCPDCARTAERERGSASDRGYGRRHRRTFREGVLARDPICTRCFRRASTEADHYPMSRDDLVRAGLDPNDPRYGRGLCHPCHSAETAAHQPGGFAAPRINK